MASDEPIEPIHGIEPMQMRPARGLRNRGYYVFARFLENLVRWKRFELSNDRNKSKQRRGSPTANESEEPENTTGFDAKA
ncbi:MAG TPA: hypothetical protein VK859_05315 [bacterium]|jgi:hypothetical protein|nr:hypothetical protein [bacterium]